ncbi:MAG TPA: polymer-forming cytoskeletal protein, partial [Terriglobia bacterium]|nr:polymer-forming cytoskeletal protein [Terriglobia bacterium]
MWSKSQAVAEPPAASPAPGSSSPVVPFSVPSASRLGSSTSRSSARLGASIQIKGQVTGDEDLQIDGKVDGPISLRGHELIVGSTAQLNSEIHAGEVVV